MSNPDARDGLGDDSDAAEASDAPHDSQAELLYIFVRMPALKSLRICDADDGC